MLPSCCLSFNGVPNPSPISNHPELQYLCTCTHTWWLPTHPILPIIIHQTHLLLTILDHLLRQCYQLLSLNLLQTHQPNMRGRERKLATELVVTYLIALDTERAELTNLTFGSVVASFSGCSAWAEKKEPGTHCLCMLSSPRISGNLEISVKSAPLH